MKAVRAVFPNRHLARRGIAALLDRGVRAAHISALFPAEAVSGKVTMVDLVLSARRGISWTTPRDSLRGAFQGAGLGACLAGLAMMASLFHPDLGWLTGDGALLTSGLAALGTMLAGGLSGSLVGGLSDRGAAHPLREQPESTQRHRTVVVEVDCPEGALPAASVQSVFSKYLGRNV